eukprot:3470127-Prymnesium_polylepis.1
MSSMDMHMRMGRSPPFGPIRRPCGMAPRLEAVSGATRYARPAVPLARGTCSSACALGVAGIHPSRCPVRETDDLSAHDPRAAGAPA